MKIWYHYHLKHSTMTGFYPFLASLATSLPPVFIFIYTTVVIQRLGMEIETESSNTEIHNNLTFGIMTKLAQRHQAIDKFLKNEPKPKTQLHKRQRRIKRHKDML